MSLTGKTALITGSTRGIGFATAQRLAKEGVHVYINANEDVSPAVEAIKSSGSNASGVLADLSSADGVTSLIQQLPKVDILIHNLGIHSDHVAFWDSTDELYEKYFQANVMSGIRLCRHYLKHMIDQNEGRVVFVSSVLAKDPTPPEVLHQSICDAAKWTTTTALAQLTRNTNVTVNSIMPGGVATEGAKETFGQWFDTDEPPTPENMNRKMREAVPQQLIGRFIEPSEIAGLMAYLCSDEAGAINGSAVNINGGWVKH